MLDPMLREQIMVAVSRVSASTPGLAIKAAWAAGSRSNATFSAYIWFEQCTGSGIWLGTERAAVLAVFSAAEGIRSRWPAGVRRPRS